MTKTIRRLGLALVLWGISGQPPWALSPRVTDAALSPSLEHHRATQIITHYIANYHYKKVPLDDALSAEVLRRYVEDLDPGRGYFLEEDLVGFSVYRDRLDDALRHVQLEPAFEIFKVFRRRLTERVEYAKGLLDQGFDYTVDEDLVLDRSRAPWARNRAELDDIWRKRVKNDFLALRVTGQNDGQIKTTLKDRYNGLVGHAYQLTADDVFEIFINAYAGSVEPHTAYFSPRNSEDFRIRMSLSLEGIGAVLRNESEYTTIQQLVTGGPADRSGRLHPEDRIVGVGEGAKGPWTDIIGWRLEKVVDLIRGPRGTVVRLRVMPKGATPEAGNVVVMLTRDTIKLEDQAAQESVIDFVADGAKARIGVIKLPTFYIDFAARAKGDSDYRSTTRDVRRLLAELQRQRIDGLVMDLRGNGGGSLVEATELTGLFIRKGPIVQVRDASGGIDVNEDPDPALAYAGPLAVLVDRQSASASEIFAGAIQDYGRGIIIGEPTFGKGTVQNLIDLERVDRQAGRGIGQLKTTVAQFFRVSGSSTQHRGVIPDVLFPNALRSEEQGERALENALPWDHIRPADYDALRISFPALQEARSRHDARVSASPIFKLMMAQGERLALMEKRNRLSLRESQRRAERDANEKLRIEIEAQFRKAFASELKRKTGSGAATARRGAEEDAIDLGEVVLYESAEVLRDYIQRLPAPSPVTRHAGNADPEPGVANR